MTTTAMGLTTNNTITSIGYTVKAVIELINLSFISLHHSVVIFINRFGLSSRVFAAWHRFGLNALGIAMKSEILFAKVSHGILNVVEKVNNPRMLAIALFLRILYLVADRNGLVKNWTNTKTSEFLSNRAVLHKGRTNLRKLFREATLTSGSKAPNVLHPEPRRDRLTAIKAIQHIISQTATHRPYHLQPRPNQINSEHNMIHFWASDTSVPHRATDKIDDLHIITQIDSDYYTNMNDSKIINYNPHLLYTFDPTEAAAKHSNYPAWTFVDDETLEVTSPAEKYRHKLWDYTPNEVRYFHLNKIFDAVFTVFEVEKRRIDRTHSLVLINPRVKYTGLAAYVARCWYGESNFARVNVGKGDYAKMEVQHQHPEEGDTHTISIARKGETLAATCDIDEYNQMFELTMRSKLGCTVPKIKTKTKLTDAPAALLTNYLNDLKTISEGPKRWYRNYALQYAIRTHQYFPNVAATLDPNPAVIPFANALFDGCFVHSNELGSEIQAIESRLTKLIRPFTLTPKHTEYMDSFISRLVPADKRGKYEPVDDDTVFEYQNRPTQKTILEYALESNVSKPVISTFAKKEAAGKINDTRIISVGKPAEKLRASKFLYPFSDWLKEQKWYCFGKTPKDLAEHLAKTATKSQQMNCTDFSRMDGRKNIALRTYNYKLMVALFGPQHAHDLRKMYEDGCHSRGFTPTIDGESFFFETYMAFASGDPFTSSFNSCDNAIVVFTGYVNKFTDNGAVSPNEDTFDMAYDAMVEKANIAGDDTALGDMPDACIVNAASWWGHDLKSQVYLRGEPGVNFLARIYGPDLWNGDPNSCTDISRAVSKLHATPNLKGFTPLDKMAMKLTSLKFTDGETPIIGDLINLWLELGGTLAEKHHATFMSYWSQYDMSAQYPNHFADWMYDTIPSDDIDWEMFDDFLERAFYVDDFLYMPTIWAAENKPLPGQQIVQTIAGEQELIGPDTDRIDQPTTQGLPANIAEVSTKPISDTALDMPAMTNAQPNKTSNTAQKDINQDIQKTKENDKGKEKEEEPKTQTGKVQPSLKNRHKTAFIEAELKKDSKLSKKQLNKLYTKHLRNQVKEAKAATTGKPAQ
jgi:hypothetical protein